MRAAAAVALLLLTLPTLAGAERPPPDRSPVRLLLNAVGRCSAVVMGPRLALTAAHCLLGDLSVDGRGVIGVQIGEDLARLRGSFDPPYARLAGAPTDAVLLEGFGCHPRRVWFVSYPVRSVRTAWYVPVQGSVPGLEIALAGEVCPGDSGGAIWADRGNLIGVITARASEAPYEGLLAFGTPARL